MTTNSWTRSLLAGALCVAGALALWQTAPLATGQVAAAPGSPTRIAVINLEVASAQLDELKARMNDFNERVKAYQKQVDEAVQRWKIVEDDLRQLKPGDARLNAKRVELFEARSAAEARTAALKRVIDSEKGEALLAVYQRLVAAAQEVCEREGFDVVLSYDPKLEMGEDVTERAVQATMSVRQVLYASSRVDITRLVVTKMNNDYAANKGK